MASTAPQADEAAGEEHRLQVVGRFTRPLHRCRTVGHLIVYYRELKGWKQKQLWTAMGMDQGRLSSLERDVRKPSFEEMERIALYLGQPFAYFSPMHRPPAQPPPL